MLHIDVTKTVEGVANSDDFDHMPSQYGLRS